MIPPIDFTKWIDEHAHLLKPPVGNKVIFEGADDLIVMVVGGPNARTDYHVDPYEELFYQVRGNMHVNVITPDGPDTVHIREGQMWLLPRGLPHSPQRPEPGSIGFLVERVRPEGTLERFQWYCPDCSALVYEVELQVRDIVLDLPPVFEAFYADEKARTCDSCGALHPGKG
ncbi:3-hydroxyanthranilate 3,4-dioxygenase [Spongiactinospora sp. TRM90649]|uniref:3-hydroxyanthranilate 3,4-dioxygenase n=1 Tax=Spongiactinospora sp. TRM90649 TaxID=3031114 RepID=UPI0023F7D736|nr:3-hydroxyanthranilate 3,4-dioxygenase [Spongiactinospora sp. TRM90649]MDF5758529.1 3-hydroxyanthranilate 3,4-dioxygenase [Spongiactinospora sp. TRM90649]